MTRAFKFVRPEDEHYIAGGTILLGSAAHYARLEDGRCDKLEGAVGWEIDSVELGSDPAAADHIEMFARAGFMAFGPNASLKNVRVEGLRIIEHDRPTAIFCMSRHPVNSHLASLGLTCVYEIPDVAALAEWCEAAFPDLLFARAMGPVVYEDRTLNLRRSPRARPDTFGKRREYEPEDEYRICWRLRRPLDTLVVPIGLASKPLVRKWAPG